MVKNENDCIKDTNDESKKENKKCYYYFKGDYFISPFCKVFCNSLFLLILFIGLPLAIIVSMIRIFLKYF